MMQVGRVRVLVGERLVPMRVAVRLLHGHARWVLVLVMLVVDMRMFVSKRLVNMRMPMPGMNDEQNADGHHGTRRCIPVSKDFMKDRHRCERADEWRGREERCLPSGTELPDRE